MPANHYQTDMASQPGQKSFNRVMAASVFVLLLLHFIIILRRAWLCDDAYITFRTLDNLVNGYRLTWNTIERVQAYTHPLWLLLLSPFYYFYRDVYSLSLALSILISVAGITLAVFQLARDRLSALLLIILLSLSNAYIDYSTSGLENHLTHLLIVIFCIVYLSTQPPIKRMFLLSLVASLAGLNRLDTLLLYLPALAYAFWQGRSKKMFLVALAGQAPLILWELFSLFYYGFLFPNTAYAKLNTGIPAAELLMQGIYYLQNSLQRDPLTLVAIAGCVAAALLLREKSVYPLFVGVLFYLFYVVKIGGDFMSGRFLSAPFLFSAIILSRICLSRQQKSRFAVFSLAALALALLAPQPFYRIQAAEGIAITDTHGISDERLWYFGDFGLFSPTRVDLALSAGRNGVKARQESAGDLYVIAVKNTGVFGFYAGPSVFVIDQYALSDPLLARLPAERKILWRVGHYSRVIPDGYIATVYDLGRMGDENLAKFYDKLSMITAGRLTSLPRLVEIWKMNAGQYDHFINRDAYRYPEMVFVTLVELNTLTAQNVNGSDRIGIKNSGIQIDLDKRSLDKRIRFCLEGDDDYVIEYRREYVTLGLQELFATSDTGDMVCYLLQTPQNIAAEGFDQLRVFPLSGNGEFGVGALSLDG